MKTFPLLAIVAVHPTLWVSSAQAQLVSDTYVEPVAERRGAPQLLPPDPGSTQTRMRSPAMLGVGIGLDALGTTLLVLGVTAIADRPPRDDASFHLSFTRSMGFVGLGSGAAMLLFGTPFIVLGAEQVPRERAHFALSVGATGVAGELTF